MTAYEPPASSIIVRMADLYQAVKRIAFRSNIPEVYKNEACRGLNYKQVTQQFIRKEIFIHCSPLEP